VLRLRLLGDFAVGAEGQELRRLRAQKYARLLAYIAAHPNRAHGREELIDLFWPDEPFENGRNSLKTALSSLRRQLNEPHLFLQGARDTIKLNLERVEIDVSTFEAAVRARDPMASLLYGGPFLPGCYDDWALDERNRLDALLDGLLPFLPPPSEESKAILERQPTHKRVPERRERRLPCPITRFFGRKAELSMLREFLITDGERLVTVTGLGGLGKTRLAIEIGRELPQNVVFIGLSENKTHDTLPTAMADALRLDRTPFGSVTNRIIGELESTPTVIILDNFEQLVGPESGRWVTQLLESVPSLSIIATSRVPLGIDGERVVNLCPLQPSDAVQLFIDRARLVLPDFPASTLLPDLCDCLDRMPLAIELCASWANVLSSRRMLDGLSDRFELMTSKKRTVASRHRSLHTVLEWSCPPDSRLRDHLGMLSVLRGHWTLEGAEAILGRDAPKIMDELHARSLVNSEVSYGQIRFTMFESVRDFALEAAQFSDLQTARVRHHEFYCGLTQLAASQYADTPLESIRVLDTEHSNILGAFEFGCKAEPRILATTVQTMQKIRFLWTVRGHRSAVEAYNAHLAARVNEPFDIQLSAIVFDAAGEHACTTGQYKIAVEYLNRAADAAEQLGDVGVLTQSLLTLADAHQMQRNYDCAVRAYDRALKAHHTFDGYHITLANLAGMYLDDVGDVDQAEPLYQQLLEAWTGRPNSEGHVAVMHRCLGTCAMMRGEFAKAEPLLRQSIPFFKESGQTIREVGAWRYLAECLTALGRCEEASAAFDECRRLTSPEVELENPEKRSVIRSFRLR